MLNLSNNLEHYTEEQDKNQSVSVVGHPRPIGKDVRRGSTKLNINNFSSYIVSMNTTTTTAIKTMTTPISAFLNKYHIDLSKIPRYEAFDELFSEEMDLSLAELLLKYDGKKNGIPVIADESKAYFRKMVAKVDKSTNVLRTKYKSRLGVGRYYPETPEEKNNYNKEYYEMVYGAPISLPRVLKNTLFYFHDCKDIDMVKGHPTLLSEVADKAGDTLSAFNDYIQDGRFDEICDALIQHYSDPSAVEDERLTKKDVKYLFNRTIYGGSHSGWVKDMREGKRTKTIGSKQIKYQRPPRKLKAGVVQSALHLKFEKDCKMLIDKVYDANPALAEKVCKNLELTELSEDATADEKKTQAYTLKCRKNRVMSYFCGILENHITYTAYSYACNSGLCTPFENTDWGLDGFTIKPLVQDAQGFQQKMTEMNLHTQRLTGFSKVQFIHKDFKDDEILMDIINARRLLKTADIPQEEQVEEEEENTDFEVEDVEEEEEKAASDEKLDMNYEEETARYFKELLFKDVKSLPVIFSDNENAFSKLFYKYNEDSLLYQKYGKKDEDVLIYYYPSYNQTRVWYAFGGTQASLIRNDIRIFMECYTDLIAERLKREKEQATEDGAKEKAKKAHELFESQKGKFVKQRFLVSISSSLFDKLASTAAANKSWSDLGFDVSPKHYETFQFENGMFEMNNKRFRQREKKDFITSVLNLKHRNGAYDVEAYNDIDTFFKRLQPDERQRKFTLNFRAYCMSGLTSKKVFKINEGLASNGKTTETNIYMNAFPLYFKVLDPDFIGTAGKSKRHKFLIDFLRQPIRSGILNDIEGDLDCGFLKQFLDAKISCEVLFGTNETKKTQAKLEASTNKILEAKGFDGGIKRRGTTQKYSSQWLDGVEDNDETHKYKKIEGWEDRFEKEDRYRLALFHYTMDHYEGADFEIPQENRVMFEEMATANDDTRSNAKSDLVFTGDANDVLSKVELMEYFYPSILMEKNKKEYEASWKHLYSIVQQVGGHYKSDQRCRGSRGGFLKVDWSQEKKDADAEKRIEEERRRSMEGPK
jgi:hypothetical protein